jgi:hypothetical protein
VGERRGKKIRLRKNKVKKIGFIQKDWKKQDNSFCKTSEKKLPLDSPWHRSSI